MPVQSIEQLLDRLDVLKRPTGARERTQLESLLRQTARRRFPDADSLIRFHEILLYLRAYPQSPALLKVTENILNSFAARVEQLRADGAEMWLFEQPDASGIAGTNFSAVFGYDITRWLARTHDAQVSINWDGYEDHAHLNLVWPKLLPLFEEDAYVDAHAPFREWVRAAKRRGESDLVWLIRQFERLPLDDKGRAELFEPLRLWVRWELGNTKTTRTLMRRRRPPARGIFYHDAPLLSRRDVSLARELDGPPMAVEKLSRDEGERLLVMGRDTMAVRFRELHGFTHGDPARVIRADAGRGLEIFLWGVGPARRLPLLGYHCGIFFKNGVPMGYHEGLSIFERVEIGLNLFYTFRDGESAWAYARLMRLYKQLSGINTFSIDPYQLGGSGNEEGIASGAFWFYRKLGFRPVRAELAKLVAAEEHKLAARHNYRTPPRLLRRLASGHVLFETHDDGDDDGMNIAATTTNSRTTAAAAGVWDQFQVRNIGLAVARRMASEFDGDAGRIRAASVAKVKRALGAGGEKFNAAEERAFSHLALVFALIPGLTSWTAEEKRDALLLIRAKAGADELRYLRLLRRHARLRHAIIALGTNSKTA